MYGLPLVCKGCGQPLKLPKPEPDVPPPLADPPDPPKPPVADAPGSPKPVAPAAAPAIISPETWAKLEAPPPPAPPEPKPWGAAVAAPAAAAPADRNLLARLADVAVVLVLLALGAMLGEVLARKSTREVLDGLAAPKFPPTDLLLWLAGPVVLLLAYVWLGTRGKTVGGWLRRRAAG
jgi:hypothetical protein